ncbi:MAG: M1 family metallopeptidase [Bacteroidales bacterium]|nr:M1 family metallopeptidase [Bacteroidales bacterium]
MKCNKFCQLKFPAIFLFFLLFAWLKISCIFSQELYIPYNIQKAYENQTRSKTGEPGKNYFQNYAHYSIQVEFDPFRKTVKGEETINYINESPDNLNQLVIRLYQDYFKKGNTRNEAVSMYDVHNGVDIDYITIDGNEIDLSDKNAISRTPTNLIVKLNKVLLPGEDIEVSVGWNFLFPFWNKARFGTYNQSSFFVAYWYPQISVYDDIDGWDVIEFLGAQEFYNDFNDFDVEITVPAGFMAWATGNWENPSSVLNKYYLQKYEKALNSDQLIHILTPEDYAEQSILKGAKKNIFKFKAKSVSDFSFAVSDSYLWDAQTVIIDTINQTPVTMHALYPESSGDFKDMAGIGAECIKYLSSDVFGINFPFRSLTAFNGAGGMEFPMMVNNGDYGYYQGTVYLASHEIAHSYFPFMVGTNERKYAWMDEGLVTLLAKEFEVYKSPGIDPYKKNISIFNQFSGNEQELPLMYPSSQMTGISYNFQTYWRSSVAFYVLEQYLGEAKFKLALKEFMLRWKEKHPIPYDLFYTFNEVLKEDLNWFWNRWFFQPGWPDPGILSVDPVEGGYRITIKNHGQLPVPVYLTLIYIDDSTEIITRSPGVWKDSNSLSIQVFTEKQLKEVQLGNDLIPDLNAENNTFKIIRFKSNIN